ncbi:MAG: hypothetical protein COA71_13570 [SAR86 cluster bacterium]|uniref:Uncharacterized protein n=1 Tax=SAR86 cluster bacterium TaxID=2030880 RepID=A0A2A5C7V1_9GAMM|nr:MAG: hypothetical protein COA71_13570 [SAR86 cluster bacterium]
MTQLIEFPQCQHQEFRRLVFKSVFDAANAKGIDVEAYISSIYYAGENPQIFSSTPCMQKVYCRFKDLIDSTVSADLDVNNLSDCNKAYLCFRVYLHNMCMERQTMPESAIEQYLQDALKEYFQAGTKVLSTRAEMKILRYLKRLRQQARTQPG